MSTLADEIVCLPLLHRQKQNHGLFTMPVQTKQYVEKALTLMRTENKILANHPNGSIYK